MHYISTRDATIRKTLSEAILEGLATDGGLYIPESIPQITIDDFIVDLSYPEFAEKLLKPFFAEDELKKSLRVICQQAFNFPVPLQAFNTNTEVLELFHGPTSSFKDFGARFLAECINILSTTHKTTIMVATSGDTGSAVASAFYRKSHINVIVLYPKGQISKRQEHQISCWGGNVLALAVEGTFDDCQRLVKSAFHEPWWQQHMHLSSANSINIGRLLPQIIYFAYSSIQYYKQHQVMPGYIVPTGNLGNATAGYYAKLMGFPIREIALATNANTVLSDYLITGEYQPTPSIATLANAMDVGNPSNFERLHFLYNTFDAFKKNVKVFSANDEAIKKTIIEVYRDSKMIICPHTATAFYARKQLSEQPWVVVATADPCKFENIIEPLLNISVPIVPQLQAMLDKPMHSLTIGNSLNDIRQLLEGTE